VIAFRPVSRRLKWLTLSGATACASAIAPVPAGAADLTLERSSGFTIPVEVNGRELRLRVSPSALGHILLNPDAARAAGLRRSTGDVAVIGPVKVKGSTRSAVTRIAGLPARRRIYWYEGKAVEGADGLISPELLPFDNVIFRIGPERPGQTVAEIPLRLEQGSLDFPYRTGGRIVRIHFSTARDDSMATASAAALLAQPHAGRWVGAPRRHLIALDVERPVRPLILKRPIDLDGFAIARFFVRIGDHRGGYRLPGEASPDPSEIVVTGLTRSRQRAWLVLTVGLDRLSGCSSIRYRKADRHLILVCDGISEPSKFGSP
jgi:hypothetical protein